MTKLSWLIAPSKTVLRHCSSVQLGRYVIIFSHLLCSLEPIVVQYRVGIQLLYILNYCARKITLYFTFGSCLCSKWNSIFTNSLHTANIYNDFLCTLASPSPPFHLIVHLFEFWYLEFLNRCSVRYLDTLIFKGIVFSVIVVIKCILCILTYK